MTNYRTIFTPMQIGPKRARNRIWMTAHATEFTTDSSYSDVHADYYSARARGGVAVITMEASSVHPTSLPRQGVVRAYNSAVVDSYRMVAEAVQPLGTLLFAQLWHRGRETDSVVSRLPVWAPSPVPCSVYREIPHELTAHEIDELIDGYALSAHHAVIGGLDGVEIHGLTHGYLLGQFLSPATNHRTDEYGGSADNRFRIVERIIRRVREVVPEDRVVGIRVSGDDGDVEGGLRNRDWVEIAQRIDATGAVDYVSVSQGTYLDRMRIYGATPTTPGHQIEATAQVKAALGSLPVVVVGRITTPEMAEQVVGSGKADMIGMARQLIADPDWVHKAQQGRPDDIRPCVGANHCVASIARASLACIHNPAVGQERELHPMREDPAVPALRVAVVGAGPAGLRAALTAAEAGHSLTLFEREQATGGQVAHLARVDAYREWGSITDWMTEQLRKTGAELRLGHEVVASDLIGQFDRFIIATGSSAVRHGWTALRPARWNADAAPVPGTDQWNVFTIEDVLGAQRTLPTSVLVFDDLGDRRALAVAEYLADPRRHIELVTRLPQVGIGLTDSHDLPSVITRIRQQGVKLTSDRELLAIEGDVVTLGDVYTGDTERREPVDAVVLTVGQRADNTLLHQLQRAETHVQAIGDCVAPRRIFDAVWEGELAARRLTDAVRTTVH